MTVSIMARFVWKEHFPTSAFFNIGTTLTLSFFQIGLAATDLVFTKKNRANGNLESYDQMHTTMTVLWLIVYWGTIITGSVFMQFFKIYWASGRFTIKSKVKFVFKRLLIKLLVMVIVLGIIGALLVHFLKDSVLESVQAATLILVNLYGMVLLVLLLAHGLIKLPIVLWKKSDNQYTLISLLNRADQRRRAYRDALIEYHEQISICKSMED